MSVIATLTLRRLTGFDFHQPQPTQIQDLKRKTETKIDVKDERFIPKKLTAQND